MMRFAPLIALMACTSNSPDSGETGDTSGDGTVPWSGDLPALRTELPQSRGLRHARSLVHMHSPWSHDACDGDGYVDGVIHEECLVSLRDALCRSRIDAAFFTDHPSAAADQTFADLFLMRDDDEAIMDGADQVASRITCDNGHQVHWFAGIEDILMPVGLERHVAGDDAVENDRLYNLDTAEAMTAEIDAGGFILQNHTEGKPLATLQQRQADGLGGVETFNLHAMFAPDIREEDLGLDPLGWAQGIAPFTNPDATGEPDLMFLGVIGRQGVSIDKWVTLNQDSVMVAVAGTDAHQNVLPLDLRDGERGDSYRRMMRWMANTLLVDSDEPGAYEEALRAGRNYLTFHALGVPEGFEFFATDAASRTSEMGSTVELGVTLTVGCPVLSSSSPRGAEEPELAVRVYRDGEVWREQACGALTPDEAGVYHVEIDMTPFHLRPFLGEDPEPFLVPTPWVQSNAIRVGLN